MELIKNNEQWTVDFYDHKPLSFDTKEDLEKYLNGNRSNRHGYMEYERVPSGVKHIVSYDIDYEIETVIPIDQEIENAKLIKRMLKSE